MRTILAGCQSLDLRPIEEEYTEDRGPKQGNLYCSAVLRTQSILYYQRRRYLYANAFPYSCITPQFHLSCTPILRYLVQSILKQRVFIVVPRQPVSRTFISVVISVVKPIPYDVRFDAPWAQNHPEFLAGPWSGNIVSGLNGISRAMKFRLISHVRSAFSGIIDFEQPFVLYVQLEHYVK